MNNNSMERTNDSMTSNMMNPSFYGEFTNNVDESETRKKECAIIGLIKNQINVLEEEIDEAHKSFSRAYHNERYSQTTYEADEKCKMLKAKKDILVKVKGDIEDMLTLSEKTVMAMSA